MTNETLGRLERVDVREIWSSESGDFTPWLGREGNLAILSETLGIELELEHGIGRTDFSLNAVMRRPLKAVGAEIYISGSRAKAFYRELHGQRKAVEEELGYELRWEELSPGNDSRIWAALDEVDVEDRGDWARQHRWLAERLDGMHRAFEERIRNLDGET